jgi:nucleoside-diphosphate-sugar epimerase
MLDLLGQLERILGRPIPHERQQERPGDVRRHCADVSLLRQLIAFEPQVSLEDGLARTVEFYRRRWARRLATE